MSPIVVVKVGGSLLDWSPLPGQLTDFLMSLGDVRPVMIVGGGPMVDSLRSLDRLHQLGETKSHWLALRVLDVTAHLLADLLPGSCVVTRLADLAHAWSADRQPILAPRLVLEVDDLKAPDQALPHSWAVTTDSIAARVATLLGAQKLILLKSAPAPNNLATALDDQVIDKCLVNSLKNNILMEYVCFRQNHHRVPLAVTDQWHAGPMGTRPVAPSIDNQEPNPSVDQQSRIREVRESAGR